MKHVTTKLLMSFVVISMAIIALSTVTLAWFTLSTTVKVNEFELNFIPDDGLEVRVVQERLDYDSGWRINTETKLDGNLIPITTQNGVDFKNFDFTTASVKHYISFKAYFRSRVSCDVLLSKMDSSSSTCVFSPYVDVMIKENNNYIMYGPHQEKKTITSIAVSDAFRASFIINGTSYIYIFNKEKGQGCYNGFWYNNSWYNPAIEYYNKSYNISIKNPFIYVDDELNEVDEKDFIDGSKTNISIYHKESSSSKMKILNIEDDLLSLTLNSETNYYEGNMDVNIWLEGWDADCFNAINNTTLSMIMGFKKRDNL